MLSLYHQIRLSNIWKKLFNIFHNQYSFFTKSEVILFRLTIIPVWNVFFPIVTLKLTLIFEYQLHNCFNCWDYCCDSDKIVLRFFAVKYFYNQIMVWMQLRHTSNYFFFFNVWENIFMNRVWNLIFCAQKFMCKIWTPLKTQK